MYANTRNKLLPAAFATSDKDEKIPEPTVVPTPSAITALSPSLRPSSFLFSDIKTLPFLLNRV